MRFILLVSLVAIGCAPRPVLHSDSDCIGMTLDEAIEALGLSLDESPILEEPPGIARGLSGKDPDGQYVALCLRRGDAPFSAERDWSVAGIKKYRVFGIARKTPEGWKNTGEVIWQWHSD